MKIELIFSTICLGLRAAKPIWRRLGIIIEFVSKSCVHVFKKSNKLAQNSLVVRTRSAWWLLSQLLQKPFGHLFLDVWITSSVHCRSILEIKMAWIKRILALHAEHLHLKAGAFPGVFSLLLVSCFCLCGIRVLPKWNSGLPDIWQLQTTVGGGHRMERNHVCLVTMDAADYFNNCWSYLKNWRKC